MKLLVCTLWTALIVWVGCGALAAQTETGVPAVLGGSLTGSIQMDAQVYVADTAIGAPDVPERFRNNAFANLNYNLGGFTAGVRYEAYLPPLLGFDPRYEGQGIAIRFAEYRTDWLRVTLGHSYEQFGSGMALRAWWEPLLGVDNAIDGVNIHVRPVRGLYLKGVYGTQRNFFGRSPGVVRGTDAELVLGELLDTNWRWQGTEIRVGGSFVSRYQPDQDPIFILPENVGLWAARLAIEGGGWNFYTEYAAKVNDPNATNGFVYVPGQGLYTSLSWSQKGLGASLEFKYLDNLDFRADRTATGMAQTTNFLPPLARQHTWRMPSLYLYATQPNGEWGLQGELTWTGGKGKWGGPLGTTFTLNVSHIRGIDTTSVLTANPEANPDRGYTSRPLAPGKRLYYQDINLEATRRFGAKWKGTLAYLYMIYDKDQILQLAGFGKVYVHSVVAEAQYKLTSKRSIRAEVQGMFTQQDFGSWAMLLLEYNAAPHWFFALSDEWNYGNEDPARRQHYYGANVGYNRGGTRIQLGYNRMREGVVCIGGVCRVVPASNGVTLSLSSTF